MTEVWDQTACDIMTLAARLDDLEATLEHMLMDVFVSLSNLTVIFLSGERSLIQLRLMVIMMTIIKLLLQFELDYG